jgi:hypothetical protein
MFIPGHKSAILARPGRRNRGRVRAPSSAAVASLPGWTGGGDLVTIIGTNFRLPTASTAGQTSGAANAAVAVRFGDQYAPNVYVESSTVVVAETPRYAGTADIPKFSALDITLQNLDADGNPILEETVIFPAGFTYKRPALFREQHSVESPFQHLIRELLRLLKREMLLESGMTTETDYSADGFIIVKAEAPSLTLVGPAFISDAYGAENEEIVEAISEDKSHIYPSSFMHTLQFNLLGFTTKRWDILAFSAYLVRIFRKHPYFVLRADVPQNTVVRLPMIMTSPPVIGAEVNNANLASVRLSFELRRVSVLYLPPYKYTAKIKEVQMEVQPIEVDVPSTELEPGQFVEIIKK